MVTAQSEALRLADALAEYRTPAVAVQAADELRRLHAANVDCMNHFNALMAERNDLLHALVTAMPFVEDAADDEVYKSHRVHKVLGEIKAAIANAMGGAA